MTANDPRIDEMLEAMADASAQLIAAHAALMTLIKALEALAPDLPEFISRSLLNDLAPSIRRSGDPDAERHAASIERLGKNIKFLTIPVPR